MNIQTAAKIKAVAQLAHHLITTGDSLKDSKARITAHTKVYAGYESNFEGVDMMELLEAFEQPMDCRTKSDFARRLELLIETMENIESEIAREARRAAEEHQNTVMNYTGADFVDELYDAHTEALDEEHARNNAAAQVTFWGANDYAARRAIVEAAHAEALEIDLQKDITWRAMAGYNVFDTLTSPTHRSKAINAAHAEALQVNAAIDTELAILSGDIKGAYKAHAADVINETVTYYIQATHKRLIQNHGITLARATYNALAQAARPIADAHREALALDRVYNVMHGGFVDPVRRNGPKQQLHR